MTHPFSQFLIVNSPNGLPIRGMVVETNAGPIEITAQTGPVMLNSTGIVVKPYADPAIWLELDPTEAEVDLRKYTFGYETVPNATDPIPLLAYTQGVNINASGQLINSNYVGIYDRLELHWQNPNDSPNIWSEAHNLVFVDPASRVIRCISASLVNQDVRTTELGFRGRVISFLAADDAATPMVKINYNGGSPETFFINHVNGIQISGVGAGSSVIYNANNNRGFLVANRNGAGACCLIYLDASNQVAIGKGLNWIEADGVVLFNDRVVMTTSGTDAVNMAVGTTDGLKIGTSTSQKIGFYNSTPQAQLTVTGAKGGNAALTSLITQLAALGLVVDGTT